MHRGTKLGRFETSIHFPTSSEVSERTNEHESEASSADQANELEVQANEQIDERLAQHLGPKSWLF